MPTMTTCRRCGHRIEGAASLDEQRFFIHVGECPADPPAMSKVGAFALRREAPGWTLGELLHPGMLIASGPGHVPYLVERIRPQDHQGLTTWCLTGWTAPDGVAERNEHNRWWLNDWVAVRYEPAPLGFIIRPAGVYDYECPARDFCFIVVGQGGALQDKRGQLGFAL